MPSVLQIIAIVISVRLHYRDDFDKIVNERYKSYMGLKESNSLGEGRFSVMATALVEQYTHIIHLHLIIITTNITTITIANIEIN